MFKIFHKKSILNAKLSMILAIVLALVAIVGFIFLLIPAIKSITKIINNKTELIVIKPADCDECFDIYKVVDFLKNDFKINFTSEKEYNSNDRKAKQLMKANNINTLPTFLIKGKGVKPLGLDTILAKETVANYTSDLFVYKNIFPPYLDVDSNKVRGDFNMILLTDDSCTDCYDVETHKAAFKNLIINPREISKIDVSSDDGKKLVSDYKITYVPTVVLQGDLDAYKGFKDLWQTVGSIEDDGTYIFREDGLKLMGKYKNLDTGELLKPAPAPKKTGETLTPEAVPAQ